MKKKPIPVSKFADLVLIIEQDRTKDYRTFGNAATIMRCIRGHISPDLWDYLIGMLQGFDDDTQLEIADDLLDFVFDKIVHLTGFPSVDTVLIACYELIAKEKGFKFTDNQYLIQ